MCGPLGAQERRVGGAGGGSTPTAASTRPSAAAVTGSSPSSSTARAVELAPGGKIVVGGGRVAIPGRARIRTFAAARLCPRVVRQLLRRRRAKSSPTHRGAYDVVVRGDGNVLLVGGNNVLGPTFLRASPGPPDERRRVRQTFAATGGSCSREGHRQGGRANARRRHRRRARLRRLSRALPLKGDGNSTGCTSRYS